MTYSFQHGPEQCPKHLLLQLKKSERAADTMNTLLAWILCWFNKNTVLACNNDLYTLLVLIGKWFWNFILTRLDILQCHFHNIHCAHIDGLCIIACESFCGQVIFKSSPWRISGTSYSMHNSSYVASYPSSWCVGEESFFSLLTKSLGMRLWHLLLA